MWNYSSGRSGLFKVIFTLLSMLNECRELPNQNQLIEVLVSLLDTPPDPCRMAAATTLGLMAHQSPLINRLLEALKNTSSLYFKLIALKEVRFPMLPWSYSVSGVETLLGLYQQQPR